MAATEAIPELGFRERRCEPELAYGASVSRKRVHFPLVRDCVQRLSKIFDGLFRVWNNGIANATTIL